MPYIFRNMYCILRTMSCLLIHDKVKDEAGKVLTDLIMADATDADDK